MNKFTDGPWTTTKSYIIGKNGYSIGSVNSVGTEEGAANLNVMGAAYDLLEALEGLLSYCENKKDENGILWNTPFKTLAKTAIRKARGE